MAAAVSTRAVDVAMGNFFGGGVTLFRYFDVIVQGKASKFMIGICVNIVTVNFHNAEDNGPAVFFAALKRQADFEVCILWKF